MITQYIFIIQIYIQKKEYLLRKNENLEFAKKHKIPFIDDDYDTRNWFARTKGQEWEPERGKRCSTCFDIRFLKTAKYAYENNFSIISSTLGISRWKDMNQINRSGIKAASQFNGIRYWTYNWRKIKGLRICLKYQKQKSFICKNTADVSTLSGTLTYGEIKITGLMSK